MQLNRLTGNVCCVSKYNDLIKVCFVLSGLVIRCPLTILLSFGILEVFFEVSISAGPNKVFFIKRCPYQEGVRT